LADPNSRGKTRGQWTWIITTARFYLKEPAMAITNADLSCVPAGGATTGVYVAGIIDGPASSHLFTVNSYTVSGGAVTASNPAVPANGEAALPTLTAVSPVLAPDGTSNVGPVRLTLTPNSSDLVDSSSPQIFTVSPDALVIVSSAAS
jgi:hypothetical protein